MILGRRDRERLQSLENQNAALLRNVEDLLKETEEAEDSYRRALLKLGDRAVDAINRLADSLASQPAGSPLPSWASALSDEEPQEQGEKAPGLRHVLGVVDRIREVTGLQPGWVPPALRDDGEAQPPQDE